MNFSFTSVVAAVSVWWLTGRLRNDTGRIFSLPEQRRRYSNVSAPLFFYLTSLVLIQLMTCSVSLVKCWMLKACVRQCLQPDSSTGWHTYCLHLSASDVWKEIWTKWRHELWRVVVLTCFRFYFLSKHNVKQQFQDNKQLCYDVLLTLEMECEPTRPLSVCCVL